MKKAQYEEFQKRSVCTFIILSLISVLRLLSRLAFQVANSLLFLETRKIPSPSVRPIKQQQSSTKESDLFYSLCLITYQR